MRRTNRVESVNNKSNELTLAIMTITTQLEIVRRVEIIPINEAVVRLHAGHGQISPTMRRNMMSAKRTRKILGIIACLFITAGILSLSIVISGLIIAFRKTDKMRESNIERYDLGDLRYGINNVNSMNFPSNIYLSNVNKMFIQKYLSDQLIREPGYHGLVIDEVLVQDQVATYRRKKRETSCSILFIIQNIQVYFDQCSTCINDRNLLIRRSFSNITAFRDLFDLLLTDFNIITEICSIPNISRLINPVRLNISSEINSSLFLVDTNFKYISSTIPLKRTSIDPPSSTVNLEEFVNHLTTEFDSSQTQVTSSIFAIDVQTSDYIEQTTPSPVFISLSTQLAITHRQSSIKSSITTTTLPQKTIPSMFQFVPFRPSTTTLPWRSTLPNYNKSFTMTKTNIRRPRISTIN